MPRSQSPTIFGMTLSLSVGHVTNKMFPVEAVLFIRGRIFCMVSQLQVTSVVLLLLFLLALISQCIAHGRDAFKVPHGAEDGAGANREEIPSISISHRVKTDELVPPKAPGARWRIWRHLSSSGTQALKAPAKPHGGSSLLTHRNCTLTLSNPKVITNI